MAYRPLTDLVPRAIPFYLTEGEYIGAVGTGANKNPNLRPKQWRDNALLWTGGNWWETPSLEGTKSYQTFATDANGAMLLTPIESQKAYETYSGTVINTYREFKDMFPVGVPYLVTIELPKAEAVEFNYGGTGQPWGLPVIITSDLMIVMDSDGKWKAVQYQEFVQKMKTNLATPEAMFDAIDKVVMAVKAGVRTKAESIPAMRRILVAPPERVLI